MTETVVHVTTLEQWKSVLDAWFKQGYALPFGDREYSENTFENGGRFLFLDDCITYSKTNPNSKPFIEYSEFMAQQKEDNKMETYYVTQEQLDLIKELKSYTYPLNMLLKSLVKYSSLNADLSGQEEKALLRYIGGDETVEFNVKEPLYRLWRLDECDGKVYMKFLYGTPDWTPIRYDAFTAPLEEIKKWKTPAWEIEKVKE